MLSELTSPLPLPPGVLAVPSSEVECTLGARQAGSELLGRPLALHVAGSRLTVAKLLGDHHVVSRDSLLSLGGKELYSLEQTWC